MRLPYELSGDFCQRIVGKPNSTVKFYLLTLRLNPIITRFEPMSRSPAPTKKAAFASSPSRRSKDFKSNHTLINKTKSQSRFEADSVEKIVFHLS